MKRWRFSLLHCVIVLVALPPLVAAIIYPHVPLPLSARPTRSTSTPVKREHPPYAAGQGDWVVRTSQAVPTTPIPEWVPPRKNPFWWAYWVSPFILLIPLAAAYRRAYVRRSRDRRDLMSQVEG